MKNIALITINDIHNYGNRLQNYAVQKFLKKYNFNIENIVDNSYFNLYPSIVSFFKLMIKDLLGQYSLKKYYLFKKFNQNIYYSKYVKNNNDNLKLLSNEYDFFIVGSDQVWNPNFAISDVMLLNNIDDKKKIAFSASIGVNDIPDSLKDKYANSIKKFKSISVREDRGKEIIEELTCRKDVEVLVDPTMLLTAEEWDKVSNRPKQLDKVKEEKYILNYFLGELSNQRKKEIEKIAKKNNCHIINILDKKDPFYTCGPSEFLYLEKHAFLICTDSFHSSVFAILYNRPFVIFEREGKTENISSRLDTLINKFNLKNRRYNGKNITEENLNHDYSEAYKILEKEREKSKRFLEKALDIKN